jgi:glycosyltransferase involved in cell wall biosynthesis
MRGMGYRLLKVSENKRKKLLMIAYYFPPSGMVGSFRVMKYVKYLRRFGWEPAVITAKETDYQFIDKELERNVPTDISIYRLPVITMNVNDVGIRWIPFVLRSLRSIIKKENPEVVYLTAGPFFPLILGPIIKGCFNIPYVIELRDPWKLTASTGAIRGIKARFGSFIINVIEPYVIKKACRVILGAEWIRQEYTARYKRETSSKFVAITNGYDPEDYEDLKPVHFTEFNVAYIGKFRIRLGFRDPTAFFQAIKILWKRGLIIHFIHVGVNEPEIVSIAQNAGVSNLVSFIGPRSYHESLAYAKGSNVLLLIGIKQEETQKMFDYIGCKRPILALAPPDSDVAKIIGKIPFARLVGSEDPEAIADTLEEIYKEKTEIIDRPEFLRLYEREYLTEILANVLDEAVISK